MGMLFPVFPMFLWQWTTEGARWRWILRKTMQVRICHPLVYIDRCVGLYQQQYTHRQLWGAPLPRAFQLLPFNL